MLRRVMKNKIHPTRPFLPKIKKKLLFWLLFIFIYASFLSREMESEKLLAYRNLSRYRVSDGSGDSRTENSNIGHCTVGRLCWAVHQPSVAVYAEFRQNGFGLDTGNTAVCFLLCSTVYVSELYCIHTIRYY